MTENILKAEHLQKSYKERLVIKDINIEIKQGEVVGLLGPNGAGKTTSFYMIVGLIKADNGKIFLNNKDITAFPMHDRAKMGIGYLPQEASIFRNMSVEDNIYSILEIVEKNKKERIKKLKNLIDEFSIGHIRKSMGISLSGGERKKNEILQMNILKPDFCMLDEIDSGLDVDALNIIADNINALYKEKQSTFLIISHYSKLYSLVKPNRTIVIIDGKIVLNEDGELAKLVSENGYSYLSKKYNIRITKQQEKQSVLGTCGNKVI